MRKVLLIVLLSAGLTTAAMSTAPKNARPLPTTHAAISDTITTLEHAKKTLEADKSKDVNNHRKNALLDIEKAMQELRGTTQGTHH